VNLGSPINSSAEEWWLRPSADGLTLLLSSNRPGGQGGFDLWMCRRRTVPKLEIKPPEQKEPKSEEKVAEKPPEKPEEKLAEKPPPKPGEKPEAKPEEPPSLPGAPPGKPAIQVAWEKLEQQLSQWEAKEAQFTQKLQPIEQKVHEWDFAGAIQEGQAVRFSEPELARRWQVRQQELQWLAEWKQRAMGKIQSAPSPLKKSDLGIRGMPGQVVQVDEEKITCELSGQKTETIAWNNLGPAASRKLVDLVLDPAKPDDLLKAAVFLASVGQSAEATRYFSQAQQKGLSVQEHLELASYPLLKELAEQLRKKEYASARSALDRLEKGPALADWRRRHQELLQGVQAVLAAAQRDTEAEKLYAEAVKLYKEQELHDVKPLVEKLRAEEYVETTVVLDTRRQPPISELEKATANLGPRLTVAIKGKADFRSIQAAIDAARGGELIEIQDNGPYQEYLVIPQVKNGLTIRGKRGRWPILLPKPDSKPQDLITTDAPQLTLEWLIVLKLNPQPAALLTTHSNIPLSPVLDLHHVLLYTQGKNIINNWRGQIKGNYSIILGCFSGINNSFILMNCLFVGNCECMAFPSKFHSSTINGNIKLISGDSHTITDSIVRDIILLPGSKGRIEHSAFFGQGRPPEGSQDCFLTDPQFMDPTNWDYRLRPGSPCIGKASDGGDIGVRWTPEMLELVKVALELRRRGLITW
ncbi:MAG TPA: hypothetical protein PLQ00_10295, partial [Thermoguttaceae bacterium]|nr:hypothetical protein [Thermoguttaceae bacterium]